ncbi:MAG: hypothetical protein NC397_10455 [Clostridium sp.]|nr:hypothetical protein [Clostridium sp.]
MDSKTLKNVVSTKLWKKVLSIILAIIMGFGVFFSITAASSVWKFGNSMIAFAQEYDESCPNFYQNNNFVAVYGDGEIEYKIDDGDWCSYSKPFSIPIDENVKVYDRY